jgi:hypothetical protein
MLKFIVFRIRWEGRYVIIIICSDSCLFSDSSAKISKSDFFIRRNCTCNSDERNSRVGNLDGWSCCSYLTPQTVISICLQTVSSNISAFSSTVCEFILAVWAILPRHPNWWILKLWSCVWASTIVMTSLSLFRSSVWRSRRPSTGSFWEYSSRCLVPWRSYYFPTAKYFCSYLCVLVQLDNGQMRELSLPCISKKSPFPLSRRVLSAADQGNPIVYVFIETLLQGHWLADVLRFLADLLKGYS